jgi:prevent-host-death family protein
VARSSPGRGAWEKIPIGTARAELAEIVNRCGYGAERIVITKHGRDLVAIVNMDDLRVITNTISTGLYGSMLELRTGDIENFYRQRIITLIRAHFRL